MRWLLLILTLIALPARGGEIVGALSQNRVSLTSTFAGSEILIFGAIRHDAPRVPGDPRDSGAAPFDVVIAVEGPRQPVQIWRKARRFGIWVNTDMALMAAVPSFYAVASTGPLHQILTPEEDARLRISPGLAIRPDQVIGQMPDIATFPAALMRLRAQAGAIQQLDRWVQLDRDILFRTRVRLPANLTEGVYTTRMYLLREGRVIHDFRTAIFVRKDGLERWLSQMAFEQPWLYGLMALALALAAGWAASELARVFRR